MMKTLTAILLGIVVSPITALISAATMSKLWEWFVLRDYGVGPSYAAWFGMNFILMVAVSPWLLGLAKETTDEKSALMRVINRTLGTWFGFAAMLGIAWIVGFALHWN